MYMYAYMRTCIHACMLTNLAVTLSDGFSVKVSYREKISQLLIWLMLTPCSNMPRAFSAKRLAA